MLTCTIKKQEHQLQLTYEIPRKGCLPDCALDGPLGTKVQSRKGKLWEHNCLELFVGSSESPIYWEYNFSLHGHWNCYRFDDYREGMKEEQSVTLNTFCGVAQPAHWQFELNVDVPSERTGFSLVCPSAVLFTPGATIPLYYAPSHRETPDFHRHVARTVPIK